MVPCGLILTSRSTHETAARIPDNQPQVLGPSKVDSGHDIVGALGKDSVRGQEAESTDIWTPRWRAGLSCYHVGLTSAIAPQRYHRDGRLVSPGFKLAELALVPLNYR